MIFDENLILFTDMLKQIENAKKSVYLETYRFSKDQIGKKFRDALLRAVKRGVEVRVIMDSFGSDAPKEFFSSLIQKGGQVRFFRKFLWSFRFIEKNHRRNHRKLLIIDKRTTYIGSTNISAEGLSWRELNLKLKGPISREFARAFLDNWKIAHTPLYFKPPFAEPFFRDFHLVIRDLPSIRIQNIRKEMLKSIDRAKRSIIIENPYFVPDFSLRHKLINAVKRGVKVTLILPAVSDVRVIDILSRRHLGRLHKEGVTILFYTEDVLHAKGMLVDDEFYFIGSANLDYRSQLHQYEIAVRGTEQKSIDLMKKHLKETIEYCRPFSYEAWKKRSWWVRFNEEVLNQYRYFL